MLSSNEGDNPPPVHPKERTGSGDFLLISGRYYHARGEESTESGGRVKARKAGGPWKPSEQQQAKKVVREERSSKDAAVDAKNEVRVVKGVSGYEMRRQYGGTSVERA